MVVDEYLMVDVDLDWFTEDFDVATRIIRRLEEMKTPYDCEKKTTRWAFVIHTKNKDAIDIINMLKTI